ncbi:hypothetical protein M8494_03665 [Serratia ureilytica]
MPRVDSLLDRRLVLFPLSVQPRPDVGDGSGVGSALSLLEVISLYIIVCCSMPSR